ncbi:extracellular solute-binding protein [Palleronia abyssalis]|nr:extracellular solute-binding protein [Palleronia abyssalis]
MKPFLFAAVTGAIASSAAAQDQTVEVAMHYTAEQAAPLLACFDRYEEANPGTSITYQQLSYRDYLQTVLTSRIAGQAPDIYNVYSIWAAQMVDNGVLAEMPDDLATYVRDTYAGGTVDAATIDGTLWGVPTEVSVYMLVSNMALLREAGIEEPPTTWEGLREAAEAVTTRNDQGRIETAGFAFAESSSGAGVVHPYYALTFSKGQDIYSDDYSEANLVSEASVESARQLAALVADGMTDRTVDAYDDFPAGGVGMMIMANWYESAIREGLGDRFEDVVVSQIPAGEDWRTMQYAFFMGVDSGSDVSEAAWDVVRYANSAESAAEEGGPSCVGEMMNKLGALTANDADNAALGDPDAFTAPFQEALTDRAISQPNVLQASEIEGLIAQTLDTVIAGEAEAAPAMEDLNTQVEDILFEFY